MSGHSNEVQSLLDRMAIQDVLTRYFQGLDRNQPERVRNCFTEDVVAFYDGRSALRQGPPSVSGIDALMDSIITFRKKAAGEWKVTTHFMGNLEIRFVDRDVAETETYAIAFIVLGGELPEKVAMRSLRYMDRLRRTAGGWRISHRLHTLDWSCQAPTDFSVAMAQRVMARPGSPSEAG